MDDEGITREEWLAEIAGTLADPEPPPGWFTARELAPYVDRSAEATYKWLRGLATRGEKGVERMQIGRTWWFKVEGIEIE